MQHIFTTKHCGLCSLAKLAAQTTANCLKESWKKNSTLQPTTFLAALHPQQRQIFLCDHNVYLKSTEGTMLSITHSSRLMNCKVFENSFVNISRRGGNRMSG